MVSGQLRQRVAEQQPVHGGVDFLGPGVIRPQRVGNLDFVREARAALLVDDDVAGDREQLRPYRWRRAIGHVSVLGLAGPRIDASKE
jgi:hypothetical protein